LSIKAYQATVYGLLFFFTIGLISMIKLNFVSAAFVLGFAFIGGLLVVIVQTMWNIQLKKDEKRRSEKQNFTASIVLILVAVFYNGILNMYGSESFFSGITAIWPAFVGGDCRERGESVTNRQIKELANAGSFHANRKHLIYFVQR
jgi:NADH:ubiquinone oxidoreductase subunit 6 (subunit J)